MRWSICYSVAGDSSMRRLQGVERLSVHVADHSSGKRWPRELGLVELSRPCITESASRQWSGAYHRVQDAICFFHTARHDIVIGSTHITIRSFALNGEVGSLVDDHKGIASPRADSRF